MNIELAYKASNAGGTSTNAAINHTFNGQGRS